MEGLTDDKRTISLDVLRRRLDLSSCPVGGLLANLILSYIKEEYGTDEHEDSHAEDLESETTNHDSNATP